MSIVRMQKLTVLCRPADAQASLAALRQLGVLHVKPLVAPAGASLEAARAKVDTLQRVLDAVPADAGKDAPRDAAADGATLAASLSELLDQRAALQDAADTAEAELHRLAPFGAFDPATIAALAGQGVVLKLFRAPVKDTPDLPADVAAQLLSVEKADGYWALFAKAPDFAWPGAEEVRLPEKSTDALRRDLDDARARQDEITARFAAAASSRPALQAALDDATADLRFQEVRAGMATADGVASAVQGYLPAESVDQVRAAAAENGWGLLVEEPSASDDVPVLLRQPAWCRPISALFGGINILPGYREADVSWVVMLFFSLFFAMILGDAGYGTIFLLLTWAFRRKLPDDARHLLYVTSVLTILWGIVTGTVFGIEYEVLAKFGFTAIWDKVPFLAPWLDGVKRDPAQNVMGMSFLIGAIQISIGHVWNFLDRAREKDTHALEQLGWLCTTWFMFFLADKMIINGTMVNFLNLSDAALSGLWTGLYWLLCIGVALIVLFMLKPSEFKTGWTGLALLPLNLVSNFTDVVSYVRLYAVGAAGFAIANAFNGMILPMISGSPVKLVAMGIVGAVLLFAAHALNILLCVMSILVHAIRLNTLEFSNHKGITWSGEAYKPFRDPANQPI